MPPIRPQIHTGALSLLRHESFRAFLAAAALARFAVSGLGVLLGYHIYVLTHDPMMIGWLGLAQGVPAVTLVLYGGHIADRFSRRTVALLSRLGWILGTALLALAAATGTGAMPAVILVAGFALACAGAFSNPAMAGLEAEVVPAESTMRAVSLLGSASQAAGLFGPVLGSLLFDWAGPAVTYAAISVLLALSAVVMVRGVPDRPAEPHVSHDGVIARIAEGFRIVAADQRLIGSMALDLFAVFFGGATALLPIFATDILHAGAGAVGVLRAAQSIGALGAMLVATRHPPRRHAGLALFLSIAGFGVAIITFALSRDIVLSFLALMLAGVGDGVSMVVRQGILRLVAPGAMRGRISAVRSVFINASNELGDVESGMLASAIGPVAAVWLGGVITLAVVAVTAWRAPDLRRMDIGAMEVANATT